MQIRTTARNLQITDDVRDYIERKVGKFERFVKHIEEINVMFEESRHRYSLDLTLYSRRASFHAQATAGDIFASIDEAVDKMERQIRRYKERVSDRRHRASRRDVALQIATQGELPEEELPEEESSEYQIVRSTEYLAAKPMQVDEAAMELYLHADQPFLAFINASSGEMNLLFRDGGAFKWIEPD